MQNNEQNNREAYYNKGIYYSKLRLIHVSFSITGRGSHFVSHVVFLIMLILMAKGWTVTR